MILERELQITSFKAESKEHEDFTSKVYTIKTSPCRPDADILKDARKMAGWIARGQFRAIRRYVPELKRLKLDEEGMERYGLTPSLELIGRALVFSLKSEEIKLDLMESRETSRLLRDGLSFEDQFEPDMLLIHQLTKEEREHWGYNNGIGPTGKCNRESRWTSILYSAEFSAPNSSCNIENPPIVRYCRLCLTEGEYKRLMQLSPSTVMRFNLRLKE